MKVRQSGVYHLRFVFATTLRLFFFWRLSSLTHYKIVFPAFIRLHILLSMISGDPREKPEFPGPTTPEPEEPTTLPPGPERPDDPGFPAPDPDPTPWPGPSDPPYQLQGLGSRRTTFEVSPATERRSKVNCSSEILDSQRLTKCLCNCLGLGYSTPSPI